MVSAATQFCIMFPGQGRALNETVLSHLRDSVIEGAPTLSACLAIRFGKQTITPRDRRHHFLELPEACIILAAM